MPDFDLGAFRNISLPAEDEIMATWKGDPEKPIVSIICMTFNQESYIHDAVRGFLIQKTNLPFEIIIHDDASTDETPKIIKDYAERYSKIIKPILQKENQWSKAPTSVVWIAASNAEGEYLAFCEGDDFWISREKLEIQVGEMLKNTSVNISFHKEFRGDPENGGNVFHETFRSKWLYPRTKKIIKPGVVILGDGAFMPTASIVLKRCRFKNMPDWFFECPVGDYFIQSMGALPGGALYLNNSMSFYRVDSIGSWSAREKTPGTQFEHMKKMEASLNALDEELNKRFSKEVSLMLAYIKARFLKRVGNVSFLSTDPIKQTLSYKALNEMQAGFFRAKRVCLRLQRFIVMKWCMFFS